MMQDRPYFFCGVGGSGMLPLALILRAKGMAVAGSDRALDQGRTLEKFDFLRAQGVMLFPQDGSGVASSRQVLVVSAAVEETIPDVVAARKVGAQIVTRAELLAELFNAAEASIGVAGTSGKSTTTGMIGWILYATGRDPTVMNGAVMKNFMSAERPFPSALVGGSGLFVSEVDESDGSIARYTARIAVVNNISLDHKTMDELRALFRDFVGKAQTAVLNWDNAETVALAGAARNTISYSLKSPEATLFAHDFVPAPDGITFSVKTAGEEVRIKLGVPGLHNVSNALAAIATAHAIGAPFIEAAKSLESFSGIRRRLEVVGQANGITVIDDFAHNPDKIAATLDTLHAFPGRLLILFQPHGFGPLKKMKNEFIAGFADTLAPDDVLILSEPAYFGGTTDKSVTSADIAKGVVARGLNAQAPGSRAESGGTLIKLAKPGDRIIVMGARDDTLSAFARGLLTKLSGVTDSAEA